jgi:hypothetical protein
MMDLHWTLCPHCGNNRVDRYRMVPSVANLVDSVADEGRTLDSGEDEFDDLDAKPGIELGAEPPSGALQVPDPGDLT